MAPTTPGNRHYHYALLDMRNNPIKLIKAVIADHQLTLAALLLLELHRGADAVGEVVEQLLEFGSGRTRASVWRTDSPLATAGRAARCRLQLVQHRQTRPTSLAFRTRHLAQRQRFSIATA